MGALLHRERNRTYAAKFDDYTNYKNYISYNSNNGKPYFKPSNRT